MVPFFANTEPNLALISRSIFGSNVDGREIGARFYAMSTDPQPIRTGFRGIIVDPNKKGSRRELSALRLTHNEKKTVQHCAECKVIVCNAMERPGRYVTREVFVVKTLSLPARQAGQAGQTTTQDSVFTVSDLGYRPPYRL